MAYTDRLEGNQACMNHPASRRFFELEGRSIDHEKVAVLTRNNKENMEKLFGEWAGTFRSEFLHYIWEFERCGHTFYVFTGKKGTSFEVPFEDGDYNEFLNDETIGQGITELLEELYKKLSEAEPSTLIFGEK